MRQFFKSKRAGSEEEAAKNRTKTVNQSTSIVSTISSDGNKGMDNKRNGIFAHIQQLNGHAYIDDDDNAPPPPIRTTDTRPAPHWLDGPRDATVLPDIIASTYSDYSDEADYAMKQMLAILETLNPTDETMELFETSLKAIEFRLPFDIILNEHKKPNWNAIRQKLLADSIRLTPSAAESSESDRPGLSTVQMSAVFDAIPFLFDAVACNHELAQFQNTLSMIVLIAMTGNSMIRRQSINAIQALMERAMLSQDFMCDGIVPGLFHIYQSGVGAFQSNDLRMECVQALCQVISYNTIHDRRWIFQNFLPRFSQMLKDPTMHVRKMRNSQPVHTYYPSSKYDQNSGGGGGGSSSKSPSSSRSHSSSKNVVLTAAAAHVLSAHIYILQSALHIFGNLGNMFGQKFTEVFLVPHLITLSCDMTWAVRKVACEIFVKVAECASSEVRVETLSPNFVRLLNDPNKWVSFIAYQQLGPFISLFANPDITGLDLKNGEVVVREIPPPPLPPTQASDPPELQEITTPKKLEPPPPEADAEFAVLPPNTWLPEVDLLDDFEYQLAINEAAVAQLQKDATAAAVTTPTTPMAKTPKRGERVMDSVLSGINKMFSPFERSSPKSKEVEKIAATFSSPSKRSPLSLHSAVSLMDKWSKRSNPNNPQRFPVFDSAANTNSTTSSDAKDSEASSDPQKPIEGSGIAAKCNSTDDLTKLGLEDDAKPDDDDDDDNEAKEKNQKDEDSESRTTSPRGRRIATNAWSKLDIRQKLFLRRLGALPPTAAGGGGGPSTTALAKRKALSPRLSPTRVKSPKSLLAARRRGGGGTPTKTRGDTMFTFAPPTELCGGKLLDVVHEAPPLFAAPKLELGSLKEKTAKKEEEKSLEEENKQYSSTRPTDSFAMAATTTDDVNAAYREADANEDSDDEDDDFDKSFVADDEEDEDDAPLMIEIKTRSESVSQADLTEQKAQQEPVATEYSLTYWQSNYAISSILDDELKPFGSSSSFTNSPTSNNYLESRFDVMKVSQGGGASPRARSQSFGTHGSPIASSPRRKANSTSEESSPPTTALLDVSRSDDSVVMLNTEEKEKLGILDIDEMKMSLSSSSSMNGEVSVADEEEMSLASLEQSAFQHVPSDLVESYMKVMGPNGHSSGGSVATGDESLCAEIYRHCAHNFPAICYTLGRAAWPKLNLVFRKLAMDEQARVRQSISYSIHEIANMLGQEITDEDLLPVFYDLRNDQNSDVRNGILMHLYDFVKCLSVAKRDEMILSLPQFFPIGAQPGNQAQNGDWRSRFELISQLSKLCSLYSIQDVNLHMSGIALTLADDRVAEVRREAVMLVSTIVGALVSAEWAELRETRDIENGHVDAKNNKRAGQTTFLSEQFVDDIVSSFAKTQKWTRRQTFCFICAQILRDKQCDGIQFRYFFSVPLQNLVQDKVPNVRLASCEAMSVWRKTLIAARSAIRGPSPVSSPSSGTSSESAASSIRRDINLVSDMMVRLANDSDIDAAFLAKKCQGLTDDQQPVDVIARTIRLREREEARFNNVVYTDAEGNMVRSMRGKIVEVVRHANTPSELINIAIETEKEAPLQSMDEFDEEILSHKEQQALATPPPEYQAAVVQIAIASLEDNRDEVDMEIDEDEEEQATSTAEQQKEPEEAEKKKDKTNEADVPMDPAPSAPESPKKPASESPSSTMSSTSSSVAIQIEEDVPSPEESEA